LFINEINTKKKIKAFKILKSGIQKSLLSPVEFLKVSIHSLNFMKHKTFSDHQTWENEQTFCLKKQKTFYAILFGHMISFFKIKSSAKIFGQFTREILMKFFFVSFVNLGFSNLLQSI
jgi:hypothetical protein